VSATSIRAMMEAARISETSVDIQSRTWQYIPEDSELHTRRRENLKSDIHALSWIRTHGLNYQVSRPTPQTARPLVDAQFSDSVSTIGNKYDKPPSHE
jgi:hypothetical protein